MREGREDRLSQNDMRDAGVGKNGGGDDRTKEGWGGIAVVRFFAVGIVRFQRVEWIRVGEAGCRGGGDNSVGNRKCRVREGERWC